MSESVSESLVEKKKREARWLSIGFRLVIGFITIDLIARNISAAYRSWWDFYVVWEVAAILFTIVVTLVYWQKYFSRGEETAYASVLQGDRKKIGVFLLIIASAATLITAGLIAVCIALCKHSDEFALEWMLLLEVGCLAIGVLCLIVSELVIVKAAPFAKSDVDKKITDRQTLLDTQYDGSAKTAIQKELNELLKKRADFDDIMDDISKVLAFSDAPIGAAFCVIFLLVLAHRLGWTGADSHLLPPFIAGAVALQLLYSNFAFYIEANGAFPRWATWAIPTLNSVTPMLQKSYGAPTALPDNSPAQVDLSLSIDNSNSDPQPEIQK